jgi:osmoprotectant transport system ATP-binding protein
VVDLNLTVPSDKITVIVGPSGCGKTTTLRMVNRMLEPTSGRVVWDGTPLRSKRKTTLRRQMGYVIQSGGLFPHRHRAREHRHRSQGCWAGRRTRPASARWSCSPASGWTASWPTAIRRSSPAVSSSASASPGPGGRPDGAADGRAVLGRRPGGAQRAARVLPGLQRELSKTIILITHDIDEAIKLGDQVAILRVGGRLAQVGAPQDLLEEPADAFVEGFVGKDRGFRSLSFLPAQGLRLDRVDVVREVESAGSDQPTWWSTPMPGRSAGPTGISPGR